MDIRQPLTSTEFISRYTLLKPLADGKVRSLSAVAGATGDVVMVHYLIGSNEENEALLDAIDQLEPADRKKVVEGFVIESNHVLVTQFLSGFTSLGDWLGHHGATTSTPAAVPASNDQGPGEFTRLFGVGDLTAPAQPDATQPNATQPVAPQPTAPQAIVPQPTAPQSTVPPEPVSAPKAHMAEGNPAASPTSPTEPRSREGRTFEWMDTPPQAFAPPTPAPQPAGPQSTAPQPSATQPSDARPDATRVPDIPPDTRRSEGKSEPGEFTRLFGAYQTPAAGAPATPAASPPPPPPPPAPRTSAPATRPPAPPAPPPAPPRPALTMPPIPAVKPPPAAPAAPPAPRMPAVVPMPGAAPIDPQPSVPAPLPPPLAQTAPPPAPAPLPGASGQSEYTRLIASATPPASVAIAGSTAAAASVASPQPGAAETPAADRGSAAKPPSYLPLIITLNVIVLAAIGLVLYFVLRS